LLKFDLFLHISHCIITYLLNCSAKRHAFLVDFRILFKIKTKSILLNNNTKLMVIF